MTRKRGGCEAVGIAPEGAPGAISIPAEVVERFINSQEVRARYGGISDMTLWRWQRDRRIAFPRPVKLGANGWNFWWLPDICAWERTRATLSPQPVKRLPPPGRGRSDDEPQPPAAA